MNTPVTGTGTYDADFSGAVIALMGGIVDREDNPALWQRLIDLRQRVAEYVAAMGLDLILDEAEGYGYLRQRRAAPGEPELPRLIARRQLGYSVSLLLVLITPIGTPPLRMGKQRRFLGGGSPCTFAKFLSSAGLSQT